MDYKKLIKKLSNGNKFIYNLNNIMLNTNISYYNAELIEISYNDIKDSEKYIFIINQEVYEKILYLNKSYILLGKTGSFSNQNYIYINDIISNSSELLNENNAYDTYILHQEKRDSLDRNLEQDNLIKYINENRDVLGLRQIGMNLTFGDIKDLIDFDCEFYGKDIKVFNLIKNDNELNIIYSDNNIIKGIINIYVNDNDFKQFIPVTTYFKKVEDKTYKRKV